MGSSAEISNRRTLKLFPEPILLTSRDRVLSMSGPLGMIIRQVYLATFLMTLAGVAQLVAFWWQGWMGSALLQETCAWTVAGNVVLAVDAVLIATHSGSSFPLQYRNIGRRFTRDFVMIDGDAQAIHIAERFNVEAQREINPFGILSCNRLVGLQVR